MRRKQAKKRRQSEAQHHQKPSGKQGPVKRQKQWWEASAPGADFQQPDNDAAYYQEAVSVFSWGTMLNILQLCPEEMTVRMCAH